MTTFPDFKPQASAEQWQRFCSLLWHHEGLGMWLDVSRMAVTPQHLGL